MTKDHVSGTKTATSDSIGRKEVLELLRLEGVEAIGELISRANRVTRRNMGNAIEFCGVVNAKSGLCGEDCAFCSQSRISSATGIERYPLKSGAEILQRAKTAFHRGVKRFGIVTSGRAVSPPEIDRICSTLDMLSAELPDLGRCASLGILGKDALERLKAAGLQRYHHNLETSKRFFPEICSTHTFEDKLATIESAKEAGLEICSGGILGLGEGLEDRVEMAFTLRELDVDSIPLNFLIPIPGTPLEKREIMKPLEVLKNVAVYRLLLPEKDIRLCGGREVSLKSLQPLAYLAGANAVMGGDYLTTKGRAIEEDISEILDLGLTPWGIYREV